MISLIQYLINSPKNCHYDDHFGVQFDLCYITSKIIVCGTPSNKSYYKNSPKQLYDFLQYYHGDLWWVWNLQAEESGYTDDQLDNKVSHYPFPDHYPPSILIMINCIFEMKQWLLRSDENIVVIHCNAGKGRSGTICCGLLMIMENLNMESAMSLFTKQRMKPFAGEGVSIISQVRYLTYWKDLIANLNIKPSIFTGNSGNVLRLKRIEFSNVAKEFNLGLKTYNTKNTGVQLIDHFSFPSNSFTLLSNNVIIVNSVSEVPPFVNYQDITICCGAAYATFNLYIELLDKSTVTIPWDQFDGYDGSRLKGYKLFDEIRLTWRDAADIR